MSLAAHRGFAVSIMGQLLKISSLPAVAPPAPHGARYLDLPEVARRLNITERQARKRCAEEWLPRGLASMQASAKGRKPSWHARSDAHPLLGRAVFPEHLVFDQRHLTTDQRKALQWRHTVYLAWREDVGQAVRRGGTAEDATRLFMLRLGTDPALAPPENVTSPRSERTLLAWHSSYRNDGLKGLVDERWMRRADTSAEQENPFFAEVKRLYLSKAQPSLAFVHRLVCATFTKRGEPILSFKKCQRLMSLVRLDARIKLRKGDKAYVNDCEPYAERDYSGLRSNECWNGDHHRLDAIVSHDGKLLRPWLTAWQDVRSRLLVGWYLFAHDPNTDTILFALGDAVKAHGVPDELYVDNGKEFDSKALQGFTKAERRAKVQFVEGVREKSGVLAGLGIGITHCVPYHGQSKPIERFFRTLKDEFAKMQPTYCGGTPAEKPDDLAAKLGRGVAPSLEDFTAELGCWIGNYYNAGRGHSGDSMNGQTPMEVFASCLASKRTAPDAVLDAMMRKPSELLRIGQNGVSYMGVHFDAPALSPRFGEKVRLHIDARDIRFPHVYDEAGRFVCIAEMRAKTPFKAPLADLKTIHREKGKRRKAIAEAHQSGPRIVENPASALIEKGVQRAAAIAASSATPASIRIDGIRAEEATKAVHADERRLSVATEPRTPKMFDLVKAAQDLPDPTPSPSFHRLMDHYLRSQASESESEFEAEERQRAEERERMAEAFAPEKRSAS
jgi:hypothetical protein